MRAPTLPQARPPGTAPQLLAAALCLAALPLSGGCPAHHLPDPRTMVFPDAAFEPPPHRRLVTDNGTVLYLLEDHEVPLVTVQVFIRTGAVLEPDGKTGLAQITGSVLRTGGTRRYSAADLNVALEGMGAILETSIGREAGRASLSVLSPDLEAGLELLAEVLRYPAFAEEEVSRAKQLKIEEIRRSNDDPDTIAFREFRAAIYGNDPRGRSPTPEGISSLSRSDLVGFHRRYFHPDRLVVGVSGDFDETHLEELWSDFFGDWKRKGGSAVSFPVPERSPPPAVYLAGRDFPQTTIVIGHLAPPLESPHHYAFTLLNYILGGAGFNSRLTEEIRSNRGLAYSVGSWYRGDRGYGVLLAWCKTGRNTAAEATGLMLEVMERVRREGVTAEELAWAKEAIINNMVFSIDRTAEVVSRRMSHEYDGLPRDYLESYPERIKAVTREEIGSVAAEHLRPHQAAIVAVGEEGSLEDSFSGFETVKKLKLRKF